MDTEIYDKFNKLAIKEFRNKTSKGEYPYLWVLDAILAHTDVLKEVDLGLVDIPINLIKGTKTEGRTNAFAANFMPMLPAESEFAMKWVSLYESHLEEGIHDPIKAYEFMNRFYVLEGNKRVSVLKACDAVSVPGTVTRIIPKQDDSVENKIYYEFLDFYEKTAVNYVNFSQIGGYTELLEKIGLGEDDEFDDDVKNQFHSSFYKFTSVYLKNGGDKLTSLTYGDAFLTYLRVYGYDQIQERTTDELKSDIRKIWNDFMFYPEKPEVKLIMNAEDETKKKTLVKKLLPTSSAPVKVAFIHSMTAETSSWTYGHDLGANHLKTALGDKVDISSYYEVDTQERELEVFDKAIADGVDIIFSTSAKLVGTSMKYALDYPKVKILNCSINTNSKYIRTYFGRMHEAKFLIGALAGVLSPKNEVGYMADYPIYGEIANINAFALGAKMINPENKVYVKWAHLNSSVQEDLIRDVHPPLISGRNFIKPDSNTTRFGLYDTRKEVEDNLAVPMYNWGVFYEKTVRSIIDGTFQDAVADENKSLNDWWGLSSGLVDVVMSAKVPPESVRLINLLKQGICSGEFDPFVGMRYSKDGEHYVKISERMSAEQIITMDWFAENIVGVIPTMAELSEDAKPLVEVQGVPKVTDTAT